MAGEDSAVFGTMLGARGLARSNVLRVEALNGRLVDGTVYLTGPWLQFS